MSGSGILFYVTHALPPAPPILQPPLCLSVVSTQHAIEGHAVLEFDLGTLSQVRDLSERRLVPEQGAPEVAEVERQQEAQEREDQEAKIDLRGGGGGAKQVGEIWRGGKNQ